MYTHLLLISTIQFSRAYCSFAIIIYLLYQNKCFTIFYEFEQTCSNVQFIPSPIEVREFLLRLLKNLSFSALYFCAFFGANKWLISVCSSFSRAIFLSIPPAYPVRLPFEPTTRWQGMIMEISLCPTAPPTACADI